MDHSNSLKQPNIVILGNGDTQVTVHLHGCTITSWRYKEQELLFVSDHSSFNRTTPIAGGISFDFPCIGSWAFGPTSGFAKISEWELVGRRKLRNEEFEATFELRDNHYTRTFWNYSFKIINVITLGEHSLKVDTKIHNTDDVPIAYQFMIPTCLQLPDFGNIRISGFKNLQYLDETHGDKQIYADGKEQLAIDQWICRVYADIPAKFELSATFLERTLKFEQKGFENISIWNNWKEDAGDECFYIGDQDNQTVSIGFGNIIHECHLEPGNSQQFTFTCDLQSEQMYKFY